MTNIRKRITTLLLAVCMLLAVLPPLGGSSQVSAAGLPSSNLDLDPEVAVTNAITDTYFTFAGGSEVNGEDYLYLCLRGGVFAVYNVDTQTVIDIEELPTSLPRGVYVDETGIVWVCGSAGLFRYDPFTLEGTDLPLPSNFGSNVSATYGVTGDGNGKIYFGTGHSSYLGMYNTATETYTNISGLLDADTKQTGYAGISYKDGYLYLGIDGDMNADGVTTHAIIKYDIANRSIVSRIDVSSKMPSSTTKYITDLNLVGDVLFASFGGVSSAFYVDISGETLQFKTFKNGLTIQHAREVSEVVGEKVYFWGRFGTNGKYGASGYIEYDPKTETCTQLSSSSSLSDPPPVLRLSSGNLVTLPDSTLPGKSIISLENDEENDCIDVYYYNLQTGKEGYLTTGSINAAYSLRAPALDPTGKYIYVGAGSNSKIAKYSVYDGTVVETFDSFDYQTDSLLYHDGYLYAGNYSAATITKIDPVTYEATPLFSLRYSVFNQCRMWCTTFGGNKVFAGTTPYSGYGGMLVWYDFDANDGAGRTYVAAGPNDTDVYYADNTILANDADITKVSYTWYNAKTNKKVTFSSSTTFTGPIENQVITNLIYKDGLLYGTTTASGSSGKDFGTENAVLFVYDVTAMKVIATCDLSTKLSGFTKLIESVDQLAEDPDVPGKFWGVISGTLFTMTFDVQTKQFTVTEEQSFLKNDYSSPGMHFNSRDIIFDGPYMYVAFNRSVGTYMILKDDPTQYCQISTYSPNQMVLAADGNLYWTTNQRISDDHTAANHLYKFSIAEYRENSTTNIATVVAANGSVSYCTTEEQLAAALAVAGNTVILSQNATVSNATMATGAVLDLNGYTLSGVVNTVQGTVKDSSDGTGKISEKPVTTAPGQVALKDGSGYRVVDYTITLDGQSAVQGNDVHFWYRVAFTNKNAYALAKADTDFTLGAEITVDGTPAATEFDRALTLEWADAMAADANNVSLHICILDGAKIALALTPTVSDVVHTGSIQHTAIEGYPFELSGLGLSGTVIITEHTFES